MFLEIERLNKSFKQERVVQDLSLTLDQHRTLSILGQSGCGKTTMLKLIAGLHDPDSGRIHLDGVDIDRLPPKKRQTLYLYQEDLLFPHLNAFENIAFGLRLRKVNADEIQEKVTAMLEELELSGQAGKMPSQLSGGQRQRVSFGRAIITEPSLLLLDEPFGSLDAGTRQRMQQLFKKLSKDHQITSLFITHDLKEAILMGDQVGLMRRGQLQVYDTISEFLEDPATGVQAEMEFWRGLEQVEVQSEKENKSEGSNLDR